MPLWWPCPSIGLSGCPGSSLVGSPGEGMGGSGWPLIFPVRCTLDVCGGTGYVGPLPRARRARKPSLPLEEGLPIRSGGGRHRGARATHPVPRLQRVHQIILQSHVDGSGQLSHRGGFWHLLQGHALVVTERAQPVLRAQRIAICILRHDKAQPGVDAAMTSTKPLPFRRLPAVKSAIPPPRPWPPIGWCSLAPHGFAVGLVWR